MPHRRAHRRLGGEPVDDAHAPGVLHRGRRRGRAGLPLPRAQHVGDGARQRHHADALARRPRQRLLHAGRTGSPGIVRARGQWPRGGGGCAGTARRAQLPGREDGRAAHARPDDAADPRVHRAPAGAGPHPRRRAQFRRHELREPGHVRLLPLRLGAPRRHLRSHAPRGIRRLRVGRRRARGRTPVPHPQGHPRTPAGRGHFPGAGGHRRSRQHARLLVEPRPHRPHGEPERRARQPPPSTSSSPASTSG